MSTQPAPDDVRHHYAQAAQAAADGTAACCDDDLANFGAHLYDSLDDVIISNCVINLSPDKAAVFAEMHRVLRPGGRIGVSHVVAEDGLTPAQRAERGTHLGCIAGALSASEDHDGLTAARFANITITHTHAVADRFHSAIIQAHKTG
jgi:SAM-dependent methyltransferase